MATKGKKESVEVDGRTIRFTHPDKVLYDATGTTKADVLEYYQAVAPLLITYAGKRTVTRKRWPDGTDADSFFEKNLPQHAPDWVPSVEIEHSSRSVRYPVVDSPATLAWFAQQAALHVPQVPRTGDQPEPTVRHRGRKSTPCSEHPGCLRGLIGCPRCPTMLRGWPTPTSHSTRQCTAGSTTSQHGVRRKRN